MPEYYFSVALDHNRSLFVAPLTDRKLAISGQQLSDTSGYFLYEKRGQGESADIEIIAKLLSQEAAFRLRDMFKMT